MVAVRPFMPAMDQKEKWIEKRLTDFAFFLFSCAF